MKLDRTLVTHVSEQTESDLLKLLEYEQIENPTLTTSTLIRRLIETYISDHRNQYQALSRIFEGNHEN